MEQEQEREVGRARELRRARPARLLAWVPALLLFACGRDPVDAPGDPYVAALRRTCRELVPHVERETGRRLGGVEVVFLPRAEIVRDLIPVAREQLATIGNGPRDGDLEKEAREMAEGGAHWIEATVDRRGRIVLPDPGEERRDLLSLLLDRPESEFAKDPRRMELILLHELVHVHQHRHLETPAFRASVGSRADILARRAVLEGHAEFLTRRIASRIGLADTYETYFRGLTEPSPHITKAWARAEARVSAADLLFAYHQGREFVACVVAKLGYHRAIRRIFARPPSLAEVSRPDEYAGRRAASPWGPVAEDLRRWLERERGGARLEVIALPMVREFAGDPARAFREGFRLNAKGVVLHVLIADADGGARAMHRAWTEAIETLLAGRMEGRFPLYREVRRTREEDLFALHHVMGPTFHYRRAVLRTGPLLVDVECKDDSDLERGAERLARRAIEILTNDPWRQAWLEGAEDLLGSGDAGLRLGAVSRGRKFVPDEDWEVRWMGRWCEATDQWEAERRTPIVDAALDDPHPAVVARTLRAFGWSVPWSRLRPNLVHEEAALRRAAWAAVEFCPDEVAPKEMLGLAAAALDDGDVTVRLLAVDSLSRVHGEPGLAAAFRNALADDHPWVRAAAVHGLSFHAALATELRELVPELAAQLDENPSNAADALGQLGEAAEGALPRLREVLANPEAREDASRAIWRIAGDPEPLFAFVRESIAEGSPGGLVAVGEVGSLARPLVPDIAKALAHESKWTRMAAAEALARIGGEEAMSSLAGRIEVERDPKVLEALRKALAPGAKTVPGGGR